MTQSVQTSCQNRLSWSTKHPRVSFCISTVLFSCMLCEPVHIEHSLSIRCTGIFSETKMFNGRCVSVLVVVDQIFFEAFSSKPLSWCEPSKYWWRCSVHVVCSRSWRVCSILVRIVRIESLLAWFSTLGGAHSALGDCLPEHVRFLHAVFLL